MEKITINKSTIVHYRGEGFTAAEIAQKLNMTLGEYTSVCKILGIKGKAKAGIKRKFNIINDLDAKLDAKSNTEDNTEKIIESKLEV
jgi:hypothetical protein